MDSVKRETINKIAEKIRSLLNVENDNFNIEDVVESINGSIVLDPLCEDEARIVKVANDSFEIRISDCFKSNKRFRFTIAHELGHLFLHMRYLINEEKWNSLENGTSHARNVNTPYNVYETEANEFAASFLMPKDRFIEVAERTSDRDSYNLDKIANIFNVSVEAVEIRGKLLGIWM